MPESTFRFQAPVTKAFIDKAPKKMVVEGLASTTEVDLTGERMAESAIKAMAATALPIPLRSEHKNDWDADLGSITGLSATADHQLLMRAELDEEHPSAHLLFGRLQKGKQFGLSIGGQVNDWAWENDPTVGKAIRTYKDIALHEVSVVSQPAVASTFLSAINKSLKEQPMDQPEAVEKTDAVVPAPHEGQTAEIEPADQVITEDIKDGQTGTPVANPIEPATVVNEDGIPLNPDQPAPADQPAALPEVPHTPGNNASEEQVEEQENPHPDTAASSQPESAPEKHEDAPDVAKETDQPAHQPTDGAGHQEASPTGDTQPDATPSADDAEVTPTVPEETHKAIVAERDTLTKSLADLTTELETVKKSLADRSVTLSEKEAALAAATQETASTKEELETTQKALSDATEKARTEAARKSYQVASKFDHALTATTTKADASDIDKAFAGFFVSGKT